MAFKMECPHCKKALNVTEVAFGKTVPCPACNGHISVPQPAQSSSETSRVDAPPPWSGSSQNGHSTPDSARQLPAGMPPVPYEDTPAQPTKDPLEFLSESRDPTASSQDTNGYSARPSYDVPGVASTNTDDARVKRPFGIVWIVFYWVFTAITLMILGLTIQFAGSFAAGFQNALDSRGTVGMTLGVELLSLLGLISFHVGLIMLVTCYGLWTFRKWGLSMAKVLAIMFATLSLFSFVAALVMHTQIVANLSNTVISAAVVVYLFGSATLSEHAQRYIMQIRSRSTSPDWKRFD
jgi:hypothetical protein